MFLLNCIYYNKQLDGNTILIHYSIMLFITFKINHGLGV